MAKDTDPYNRWLDAIYDMLPGEKKWLALIRPKYHTKYKLFSIGYKLLNDNCTATLLFVSVASKTDRHRFPRWQRHLQVMENIDQARTKAIHM